MKLIISNCNDPYFNIAAEKHILTERLYKDVLFLYINVPSVIVGRNQNPEAEADKEFCRINGIPVLHRLSGGGTVYHDLGNINYCFIKNRGGGMILDEDFLDPIVKVVSGFGIDVVKGKRKDLWLNGRKISGTAAHVTRDKIMFHGTLLYDSDLGVLENALKGEEAMRGKKIPSVRSEVTNIREHMTEKLPVKEFFVKLIFQFMEFYSLDGYEIIFDHCRINTDINENTNRNTNT